MMTFTISLSGAITAPISVNVATATIPAGSIPAGYAAATGNDFQGTSAAVTFMPGGPTTATFSVRIYGTTKTLPKPLLFNVDLTLSGQAGYVLGSAIGIGTITN
jgi:hypothetical protein